MKQIFFSGEKLLGLEYEPLMPFFLEHCKGKAFKIYHGGFVTAEDGTGIVHMAPGFGEDDQILCRENGISVVCPINDAGCFDDERLIELEYELAGKKEKLSLNGQQVFDTNDDIIKYLKAKNSWIKTEQYLHDYPHCWRSDTPLIYRAISSWYVKVIDIKDRMVELNQQINWIPENIKDGQFGKWLENARDWSITRNRFWGCPVPVWKSENPNNEEIYVFGSIKEIEDFFGKKVISLHRPEIDEFIKDDPYDSKYKIKRVEDVLDCWFESGSMPYASVHYPFEKKEWFETHFPADFIVEYVAQTRGWFYTLMVLATALFDKVPFLNCICHGVILDENSQKLSKRLKNYPDPNDLFEQYGSDAIRWTMLKSQVMHGQEFNIDKKGEIVLNSIKSIINPLWNAYQFFRTYMEIDQVKIGEIRNIKNIMDIYILSKFKEFGENFKIAMNKYDTPLACESAEIFIDILNNWYIRRNKSRFWKNEIDQDKIDGYSVLYYILEDCCKILGPLLPILTEEIYLNLKKI